MSKTQLSFHLSFNGDCAEAFKLYERALGGKITQISTYGQSPMAGQVPAHEHNLVMHAAMELGGTRLMGADSASSHPYQGAHGYGVSLIFDTVDEARAAFDALCEGGSVIMPFASTFWAPGFGMVTDRFGVPWMLGCENRG